MFPASETGAARPVRSSQTGRRWLAIAVLAGMLAGSSALAAWRDQHGLVINTTDSLPHWAFWIDRAREPQRGDFVVFKAPGSPLVTAHFGEAPPPFAKRVLGMPGDLVARRGETVLVNGEVVARLKPRTRRGETLAPGPTGRIPARCYYLGTRHPDGFDSRYAAIGFVCRSSIVGAGDALL
jgi:conjugal transfer pilin signal peptidase TrbI